MLKEGDLAPRFTLPDAAMEMVSLDSLLSKSAVVLYFYPKDDAPGCTIEAIDFSDREEAFRKRGAVVLGVSMDDCISHGAFQDKHGLSVQLLSDTEGEVCECYGVLQEREFDGRRKRCIQRSTFIIDRNGLLVRAMYGVNAKGHAASVLDIMKGI